MRKNCKRAYKAWTDSKALRPAKSIWTDGETLWSYGTPLLALAENGETVVFNATRYSVTTSIHQSALRAELRLEYGAMLVEVDGVQIGASVATMIAMSRPA